MLRQYPYEATVGRRKDVLELANYDKAAQIVHTLSCVPDPTYDIIVVADDVVYSNQHNGVVCNYVTGEVQISETLLDEIKREHQSISSITIEYVRAFDFSGLADAVAASARDLIDHGTPASRFVDRVFGTDDKDSTEPDDVVADGNKELGPEQEKEIGAAFQFLVDAWARPLVNMFEIKEVPEQCQPELAISTTLQDLQDQIQLLKQPMCVANLAEYDRVKLIATLEDFAKLHKYVYYNPGRKPI